MRRMARFLVVLLAGVALLAYLASSAVQRTTRRWSEADIAQHMAGLAKTAQPALLARWAGAREPLGIYWYERIKDARGQVAWVKHVIDYSTRTGAGMQLAVADYDGDGAVDFLAPGKTGLYLFHNLSKRK